MEFASGGEGLHHELHRGQQLSGAWVAGGEVHRGERAVVDAQGEAVAVQDVEDVEDVPGTAYEAEHLGDVHGVPGPRVVEERAELGALEGLEAAGGAVVLLEDDRVLDPGLVQDEVLPGGRLLVGRDPLVDKVCHRGPLPYGGMDPIRRQTLSSITVGSDLIRAAANPRITRVHWARCRPVFKGSFADRRKLADKEPGDPVDANPGPVGEAPGSTAAATHRTGSAVSGAS